MTTMMSTMQRWTEFNDAWDNSPSHVEKCDAVKFYLETLLEHPGLVSRPETRVIPIPKHAACLTLHRVARVLTENEKMCQLFAAECDGFLIRCRNGIAPYNVTGRTIEFFQLAAPLDWNVRDSFRNTAKMLSHILVNTAPENELAEYQILHKEQAVLPGIPSMDDEAAYLLSKAYLLTHHLDTSTTMTDFRRLVNPHPHATMLFQWLQRRWKQYGVSVTI